MFGLSECIQVLGDGFLQRLPPTAVVTFDLGQDNKVYQREMIRDSSRGGTVGSLEVVAQLGIGLLDRRMNRPFFARILANLSFKIGFLLSVEEGLMDGSGEGFNSRVRLEGVSLVHELVELDSIGFAGEQRIGKQGGAVQTGFQAILLK